MENRGFFFRLGHFFIFFFLPHPKFFLLSNFFLSVPIFFFWSCQFFFSLCQILDFRAMPIFFFWVMPDFSRFLCHVFDLRVILWQAIYVKREVRKKKKLKIFLVVDFDHGQSPMPVYCNSEVNWSRRRKKGIRQINFLGAVIIIIIFSLHYLFFSLFLFDSFLLSSSWSM